MDLLLGFAMALAAVCLGAMLFFSAGVAPVIFRVLDEQAGGRFVRALFPVYYAACGATAALASLFAIGTWAGWVLIAVAAGFVWLRQRLMPAINRARDRQLEGDADAGRRFDRLHRLSVLVNAVQLVALIVVIGVLVWSRAGGAA